MKKIALIGLFSTLFITMAFSQGDPKKAVKRAKSKLAAYMLDQTKGYDKLIEAKKLIDFATKDAEYGKSAKTLNLKGKIYNALSDNATIIQKKLNPAYQDPNPDAAMVAYKAFLAAMKYGTKKYHKSDALEGLGQTITSVSNMGLNAYYAKDFDKAYTAFNTALEIHKLLKSNGKKSTLDAKDAYMNQKYITALAALNSKKTERAGELFTELYDSKFEKAEIFDGLFKVNLAKGDTITGRKLLAEGRQKYPENQALMYDEINDYLAQGKMAELVTKLQLAIEKDPKNSSLYATLGRVYDELSVGAKDKATASKNFDLAKKSYEKALKIDPKNFASVYSIGQLYYNKAAAYSVQLKELENDMSKAGMKKYDAVKAEMQGVFDEALPFFLEAEKMDGTDYNTLLALKEIYARKNNIAKSNEYKDKMLKLRSE